MMFENMAMGDMRAILMLDTTWSITIIFVSICSWDSCHGSQLLHHQYPSPDILFGLPTILASGLLWWDCLLLLHRQTPSLNSLFHQQEYQEIFWFLRRLGGRVNDTYNRWKNASVTSRIMEDEFWFNFLMLDSINPVLSRKNLHSTSETSVHTLLRSNFPVVMRLICSKYWFVHNEKWWRHKTFLFIQCTFELIV